MEVRNQNLMGGSLQISTDVIGKIASLAAAEIEGVKAVSCGSSPVNAVFAKTNLRRPVTVELKEEVAEITVNVIVRYGCRIPTVSEALQQNVKSEVQSMTGITVSKVNVVVTGVALPGAEEEEEPQEEAEG